MDLTRQLPPVYPAGDDASIDVERVLPERRHAREVLALSVSVCQSACVAVTSREFYQNSYTHRVGFSYEGLVSQRWTFGVIN